jgi:arylsulfatase A-like enzyme
MGWATAPCLTLAVRAVGAVALLALAGCHTEPTAVTTPPNIIIYLVDTLRRDHLGIYGYSRDPAPRLTAFADDAVRFERAFSPSSWTRPAVASLLSGIYPAEHGARTRLDKIAPGVELIGEYLRDAGYRSAAFVSNVNVLPIWGFDRGFDVFVDVDSEHKNSHSDAVNDAVFEHLDAGASAPFLLYIHTRDPHQPYEPPPPFDQLWPETAPADATNRPDTKKPPWVTKNIQRYDGEVSYNDDQFGKLMDRLKNDGLYRNSLIVFTADHGEEFFEHGVWGHGQSLFGEVVRIPLLIKLPGNRHGGSVVDARATLVDLLPTLLSAAGVAAPETLAGIDLLPAMESREEPPPDERPLFFELDLIGQTGKRTISSAMIRGRFKYTARSQPTREIGLWNLDLDPNEITNLANEMPETREEFAESIEAYRNLDASGVHLWVEGFSGRRSVAKGTLTTTGRFEQVRGPSHEADDRVVIHPDNRRMTFEMFLDSERASPDRDGIVFDVFPTDATIALEQLTVDGVTVAVLMGRDARPAGELPLEIVRESPDIAIDHPDELFQLVPAASGTATGASAHIGFVSRAQGELSDLEAPIMERLKALGYVE